MEAPADAPAPTDAATAPADTPAPAPSRRRRRAGQALLVVAVLGVLSGTAYLGLVDHLPLAADARLAAPLPAEVDARLRCADDAPLEVEIEREDVVSGHRVIHGKIAVRRSGEDESLWVPFHFYRSDLDAVVSAEAPPVRRPAIVVSPITNGPNKVARIVADDLASHGFHAVIVDRPAGEGAEKAKVELEALEVEMRDAVAARRRVIDWLLERPDVDPSRIGAYGVSLGGILTVSLTAADDRIRASVAVMAGGDLPAVIARSVEPECRSLAVHNGVSEDAPTSAEIAAFEEKARAIVLTDPLVLAPHIDPREIFLITTRRDTSVPSFLQDRLRDALGGPETVSLPTGHYSAILYLPIVKRRAREFLNRRLEITPTR